MTNILILFTLTVHITSDSYTFAMQKEGTNFASIRNNGTSAILVGEDPRVF